MPIAGVSSQYQAFKFRNSIQATSPLASGVDFEERLTEIDRFFVLNENGHDLSSYFGRNFIEDLHGFDDANDRIRLDAPPTST